MTEAEAKARVLQRIRDASYTLPGLFWSQREGVAGSALAEALIAAQLGLVRAR